MVKLAERSAAYIWNPNGDIDFINPSAIMADISAGDLKNAETGVAGKFHPPPPLGSMRGGGVKFPCYSIKTIPVHTFIISSLPYNLTLLFPL